MTLNTFGPDLVQLARVVDALTEIGGGIQVALFDDTWGWGKSGTPWSQLPNFNDTEAAVPIASFTADGPLQQSMTLG